MIERVLGGHFNIAKKIIQTKKGVQIKESFKKKVHFYMIDRLIC